MSAISADAKTTLEFDNSKWTIEFLLGAAGKGSLHLRPDFQRFYIWDRKKEEAFIDSILRGYPIPPIWLWERHDASDRIVHEVIDGQQRLTCIKRYMGSEFLFKPAVDGPADDEVARLQDSYFSKVPPGERGKVLPVKYQNRIRSYFIPYVLVRTQDRDHVIHIFRRLNKSSTNLTPQELRNAFYGGAFKTAVYDLTASLQKDTYWGGQKRVFEKTATDRMSDQQFVSDLIVAMLTREPQHQSEKLDDYYDMYDRKFKEADEIRRRFRKTLHLLKGIFSEPSRFTRNQADFYTLFLLVDELSGTPGMRWDEANKTILKHTLEQFEKDYAEWNEIRTSKGPENRLFEEYRETIVGRQRELEVRVRRREMLLGLLKPGLKLVDHDPQRQFTDEQKLYIWLQSDRTCGVCRKVISEYEDYEPDHVHPWIKGGRTTIINGRVTHAACNRRRRDKTG